MNAFAAFGPFGTPELIILAILLVMIIGNMVAVAVVASVMVRKRSTPTPPPLPPSQLAASPHPDDVQ